MVSFTQTLVAAAAVVAAALTTPVEALQVGDYFRPSGTIVSAQPNTTALFRRSPCPALNTLANHGYLPRNGQNISRAKFTEALMTRFNIAADLTAFFVNALPDPVSLDILSTHNFIEHDASLVHSDVYFKHPPNAVNMTLVADLLSRKNSEGRIGLQEVGQARKERLAACRANNPQCDFSASPAARAFGEAALLIGGLGAGQNDSISVAHAVSFLVHEKFPSDFVKTVTPFSLAGLQAYSAKLQAYAA
uniref:Heme haloperoxidase family profile domain-containing protein n=1 Tax=Globisporangium ultimum (strain ATCC 200006 / CBS 805.95 / DAOM BR144) TaxID=431595 RepID=K3WBV2_GLOUD